jgi:uncharacterized protein
MVNLINGAADYINDQIYQALLNNQLSKLDASVVTTMKNRRYLFENKEEYRNFLEKLDAKLEKLETNSLPSFLIIPSYACNLKCTYCYERTYDINHAPIQDKKKIIDQQFDVIANLIGQLSPDGPAGFKSQDVKITIMGGEPLLPANQILINYILEKVASNGYRANIVTNGVDISNFIPDLKNSPVEHIQITLDGPKSIHDRRRKSPHGTGSFDSIIKNVQLALKNGIKIYLRVNVDRENIDSLPELAEFITDSFPDSPDLFPYLYLMQDGGCSGNQNVLEESVGMEKIFKMEREFPKLRVFRKKYHPAGLIESIFDDKPFQPALRHCGAARNQYILDYKGNIYKCWHGVGNSDYRVGVFDDNYQFNEKKARWLNRSVLKLKKCTLCKYRYICGTGCPAAKHGGGSASDLNKPNCVDYEKLINMLVLERVNQA